MPSSAESLSLPRGLQHWLLRYSLAIGIVAAATLLRLLIDPIVHDQIPYFVYVASVVIATWFCGIDAGILSTILAGFVGNYLFVPPRYDVVPHGEDWAAMSMFWVVAFGLVWLVGRWRTAERNLRRQADELLAQAEALRGQANKLQALHSEAERVNRVKDEFLATLSHELRTPLNAIVGWAHLLVEGNLDVERAKTAAHTILRNAYAQNRLVDDLLDVSRIINGKLHLQLAPVDLGTVLAAAVEQVRPAADAKSIGIHTSLAPGAVLVGDGERLRQVAWNLISNAVKFTRKGGRVEVRLECKDSQLHITVSDTGMGVEPHFLPRLFDRFSQADSSTTRPHGGLGLGLAVVRHLVELHGGTVRATSPGRDQGATFTVTLPVRAVRETEAPGLGPAVERRGADIPVTPLLPVLHGVRVLVVDDEADARDLVEAVLTQYGADVRAAASAREAFQELRHWRPDVLVADIGMPVEDGYSLLRRIRSLSTAEGGATPAAALTAYAQLGDRERALTAGFQEHVPKPVPPEHLADVVAKLARGAAPSAR